MALFYLLISHSQIPWTLSALSQRWGNVMRAKSACVAYRHMAFTQLAWRTVTEQRDTYSLIKPFRPRNLMTEADIRMAEHRSKNTLGKSVPGKIVTEVEDEGTSEDGSPRPVCRIMTVFWNGHEIPNKKLQRFFKKMKKAKRMIYVTEFRANSWLQFQGQGRAS